MGQKDTKETRELFVPITPRNNPSAVVISPSFAAVSRHSNSITDSFHLRLGLKTSTNQKTFQKQGASLRLEVAWKFQINAVFLGVLWSDVPGYCTLALGPDFICKDLKSRKLARCRPDMTWSWDRRITPSPTMAAGEIKQKSYLKKNPVENSSLSVCVWMWAGKLKLTGRFTPLPLPLPCGGKTADFCFHACDLCRPTHQQHSEEEEKLSELQGVSDQPESAHQLHQWPFLYHIGIWNDKKASVEPSRWSRREFW